MNSSANNTKVTFYALSEDAEETARAGLPDGNPPEGKVLEHSKQAANDVALEIRKAANIVLQASASRLRTTVFCETQAQAESFDEFIWQYPAGNFIPHNLFGEGPSAGTPTQIIWLSAYQSLLDSHKNISNRSLVVNLSGEFLRHYQQFAHIVDFVPSDEKQKQAARMRYTQYKQAGCMLEYKSE